MPEREPVSGIGVGVFKYSGRPQHVVSFGQGGPRVQSGQGGQGGQGGPGWLGRPGWPGRPGRPGRQGRPERPGRQRLISKTMPCMSQYKQVYSENANGSLKQVQFI